MRKSSFYVILLVTAGVALAEEPVVRFNRDVRPILSDTCFHCHGPDKNSRKAGLRLDIREEALKPAKSKAIPIVPGRPAESEVVKRLFTTELDDLMPPEEAHKTLTEAQKQTLKNWIAQGAVYEPHWAYTTLVAPPVPPVADKAWPLQPVDNFILQKLESKQIKPSAKADKATLLRRLSLDLIGLPPTPEEVSQFIADKSEGAFAKQVDRLLANPHFGERWASWWLDVARFTDTVGFHGDQNARNFPYRDYVINAFNTNKPLDQFTREQLAGDLLPNPTPETLTASGFNRLNMVTREGGAQPKEYLAKYGAERVRTVGTTFLGSTFGCAECHDHKFDPISARDFYSLQAFFADVKQWGVYLEYGYTPNPELRGFSNDYPFPPELEVDSPALQRKQQRLLEEMNRFAKSKDVPAQSNAWKQSVTDYLRAHPTGWMSPVPTVTTTAAKPKGKPGKAAKTVATPKPPPAAVVEQDVFTVDKEQRITVHQKTPDDTTITLQPPPGLVAALRLEILPTAEHNGSILRNGTQAIETITLTAKRQPGGGKPAQNLTFHHAEANLSSPRYASGAELIGVQDAWKTSAKEAGRAHIAVYLLSQPVTFAAGDALVVALPKNGAGTFRVSVSPLAFTAPEQQPKEILEPSRFYPTFLASTNADPVARQRLQQLHHEVLTCRHGKAYTLITQPQDPLKVRILARGNWLDEAGEIVTPQTPHFLSALPNPQNRRLNRLDLANWLCSDANPLTRRTWANRLWKQFFGNALSLAPDDLGAQGEPPTHPELLDWFAMQFSNSHWDFKKMVRLLVTSATYQQSSSLRPELKDLDPLNRWLASQNPRRLEAEFVRDNALAIAGLLNPEMGGPSVKPYQPDGYYANIQFPDRRYIASSDADQYRRGVYMHWQRTFLHPMLANFDAPMRDECIANRNLSNTPQQALTLLNDPTFTEAARTFAETTKVGDIPSLFQRALARPPKPTELASLTKYYETQLAIFKDHPEDVVKFLKVGLKAAANPTPELAAWTATCRVVLNLHEVITRY